MGVKWLTSYVKEVERIISSQVSFKVGEAESSKAGATPTFVVDAWAFLYYVWLNQFGESMRGLDYEAFQVAVKDIVLAWQSVGVSSIFVFDGPCLPSKLPKILERKAGVAASNSAFIKSSASSRTSRRFQIDCGVMAPLLLQALIEAVEGMKSKQVELIFAPTEADSLVAEIATDKEQGYALSLDSDFFVLCARGKGCQYVPLDSVEYLVTVPAREEPAKEEMLVHSEGNGVSMDGFEQVGKRRRGGKRNNAFTTNVSLSSAPVQQTRIYPPARTDEERLAGVRVRAYRSNDLASHLQIPSALLPLLAALVGNDYSTSLQSSVLFRNSQGPQRINEAASLLRSEWLRVTNESKIGLRETSKASANTRKGHSRLQMTTASNGDALDDGKSDTFSSPSSATATPTRNTPLPHRSLPLTPLNIQDPVRAMVQVVVDKSLHQSDAGFANPRYVTTGEKDLIIESIIDSVATYSLLTHSDAPHLASPSALFFGHPSSLLGSETIASPEAIERYRQAYAQGMFKPTLIEAMTQRVFIASLSAEDADVKSVQTLAARELRYWLWGILFEAWGMSWAREEWDEPVEDVVMEEDDLLDEGQSVGQSFLAVDKAYKEGERPDDVISVDTESSASMTLEASDDEMDDLPSRPGSVAELRKALAKPAPGVVEHARKGQQLVGELVQIVPLLSLLNGDLIDAEVEAKVELPTSLAQLRGQHEASRERPKISDTDQPASDPIPAAVTLMSLSIRLDLYLHAHRSCTPLIQSLPRSLWPVAAVLRLSLLHEAGRLGPAKKKLNWTRGELVAAVQSACHHVYRADYGAAREEQVRESLREVLPSTRAIHLASTLQLLLETSYLVAQSLLIPVEVAAWTRPHRLYHGPTFHLKMAEAAIDAQTVEKTLRKQERAVLDAVTEGLEEHLGIDVSELRRERKAKKKEARTAAAAAVSAEGKEKGTDKPRSRAAKLAARNNFALLGDAVE